MFWRVLETEWQKEKHSPVWLAFFVLPLIPAVLGTLNYWNNQGIFAKGVVQPVDTAYTV